MNAIRWIIVACLFAAIAAGMILYAILVVQEQKAETALPESDVSE